MAHQKTLANLIQRVRDSLDEQTTGRFSDAILTRAVNTAKDRVWNEVRRTNADYFLTSLASTAGSQTILGETYAASSLQITVGGTSLTLPHDLVGIKYIEAITSGYESVRFRHLDMTDPDFRSRREITSNSTPSEFVWDIINERTFIWAPRSDTALDTRFFYFFKAADLATGDSLQMPPPLDRAVEAYATSEALLGDFAEESLAWEGKGKTWVAEFLGADSRQSQDPVFVQPATLLWDA